MKPGEYEKVLHDYMALKHHVFWQNPAKAKAIVEVNSSSSYAKGGSQKLRTCFNCSSRLHFIAECPYEPREKNAGRLVRKDKSKSPNKKPFFNKKFSNKKSRIVLVAQEECSSDDDEEEEESTSEVAAIAIASPSSSSLFESPNENAPTRNAKCLMAKATEVSSSTSSKTLDTMHDVASLCVEDKNATLNRFMANLKGETKIHFEGLLKQIGRASCRERVCLYV